MLAFCCCLINSSWPGHCCHGVVAMIGTAAPANGNAGNGNRNGVMYGPPRFQRDQNRSSRVFEVCGFS